MSMTTDLTGGLFGPTKEEVAAQSRFDAAQAHANALVEAARAREEAKNPGKLPGMPYGRFSSGGGTAVPLKAGATDLRAAATGSELGEPTSFRGGVGAPEPVGVIRGMRQTYATEAGAPNLTEFATPVQARQAFNREQLRLAGGTEEAQKTYGGYVPLGGSLEGQKHTNKMLEIAAQGKSQEAALAGSLMTSKKNLESFMNKVQSDPRFYKEGPEGLVPVSPGLGQLLLGLKSLGEADPEKAWQAFEAKATRHLDEARWVNDQGVLKVIENLGKQGFALTPGQKAWLSTPQTDPEAEKKRRDTILQWVNPPAIPGRGQLPGPVAQPMSQPRLGENSWQAGSGIGSLLPFGRHLRPLPASPSPVRKLTLIRPDQINQITEGYQRDADHRKKLSPLATEWE